MGRALEPAAGEAVALGAALGASSTVLATPRSPRVAHAELAREAVQQLIDRRIARGVFIRERLEQQPAGR